MLYLESHTDDQSLHVEELAQTTLTGIEVGNTTFDVGTEDAALVALMYTAEWMLVNLSKGYNRKSIIQRLKVNLHCENTYIELVIESLPEEITSDDARIAVNEIIGELRHESRRDSLKSLIATANRDINFNGKRVDQNKFVSELSQSMDELNITGEDVEQPGHVGTVLFSELGELEAALKKGTETISPEYVLDTGFSGMNDQTGINGIPRGALVNVGGLTHHYKSGMLIDLALNIANYNRPWLWDQERKPLILRISFENTIEQDITLIYKKVYELKYKLPYDEIELNIPQAAIEIQQHFSENGYFSAVENYNPNSFDIYALFNVLDKYHAAGYEIHAVLCDYLPLIAHNTMADNTELRIQRTYEMIRNYCYPKGIAFITGQQLSTEALGIYREVPIKFLATVRVGNYYQNCKAMSQKLDLEFLTTVLDYSDGHKYLGVAIGKNRYCTSVADSSKIYWQRFERIGGIIPDVNDSPRFLAKLPNSFDVNEQADPWAQS